MNYSDALTQHFRAADKMMLILTWGLQVYALALANWYNTWLEAIIIGGATTATVTAMYKLSAGSVVCRMTVAAALMVMTALHIHQAKGMIEMHFGVFALLAMLLYYRDWLPIITAAAVIAVHHIAFFAIQANGGPVWVLAADNNSLWVILLHALYVVVETGLLVWFALRLHGEAVQSSEIMSTTSAIMQEDRIDLTRRTSGSTELLLSFDSYTEDIESLAKQVKSTATELSTSGESLSSSTQELEQASNIHHQETSLIATAIEEMSAAVKEVSQNAARAFDATNQVDQNASEAAKVSEDTMRSVEQLAAQITEGSTTIETLNDQSNNIVSVLDVIRSIADQTNLLALNAAIEAARAGEQGRGFAVVADEVRTLAQRTQESTQEIDSMIEALQTGSKNAVSVMEQSRSQAQDCVENTSQSVSLMQEVSAQIETINDLNSMIANSANEQTSVVDEVSQNVANIQVAIERSSEDASHIAETAVTMDNIASQLNSLTNKFNVS